MDFVETPSFWCPHVGRFVCTNFSTRTVELRPSERREIFNFLSLLFIPFPFSFLPSFSFPLSFYKLLSSMNSFSSFFLFFPFCFSLSYFFLPISLYEFFLFFLFFFFCFFLFFPFLFDSLFFSYFSSHFCLAISPPIWSIIDRMGQRRQFPPHFLMSSCVALIFPSFIPYFLFLL